MRKTPKTRNNICDNEKDGPFIVDESQVKVKGRRLAHVSYAGSFHSPENILAKSLKATLDKIKTIQPVKHIDPTTLPELPKLSSLEFKRLKAAKLFKKFYFNRNMRNFGNSNKFIPRTEAQCDTIIEIARQIAEYIKNNPKETK